MICTVLYNTDDSKALKAKGFSGVEEAKVWMDENSGVKTNNYVQNCRIVIDYSAMEAYKEMYELMKLKVFDEKTIEKARKTI